MAIDPRLIALPGPALGFEPLARQPGLRHAIFTRRGGRSKPPYDSLNVAFNLGDSDGAVMCNRQWIETRLGNGPLLFMHQAHGRQIVCIDRDQPQQWAQWRFKAPVADALITNVTGINLVVQTADCQAILLYDPQQRVVAGVHAGWRGSVANIVAKTVAIMTQSFGVNPADLWAAIGPSLGPCCAEFVNYKQELPAEFWKYHQGRARFDFWAVTRDQLLASGLGAERIFISHICTRCRQDSFFSFRRQPVTGRLAAVIGLAED